MSLYNQLFGCNSLADVLLYLVNLKKDDFARFRDVYLQKTDEGSIHIVVYARIGGGNRNSYQDVYNEMLKNSYFIKDYDDNFDSTYAHLEFKTPLQHERFVHELYEQSGLQLNPSQKWEYLNKLLKEGNKDDPLVKTALSVGEKIMSELNESSVSGSKIIYV